jgi:hypothetical protein
LNSPEGKLGFCGCPLFIVLIDLSLPVLTGFLVSFFKYIIVFVLGREIDSQALEWSHREHISFADLHVQIQNADEEY